MCRRLTIAVILATGAMGCSGVEIPHVPEGAPVSYGQHLETLVVARCLECHTAEEPEAELVLEVGTGFGEMVGRPSTQVPELMMVVPGDVESSYLWLKLNHDVEIGRGMPRTVFGSIRLPDEEIELYRRWIAGGALP